MRMCRAIIRSKLDYGCVIYSSATDSALAALDPVYNSARRLSCGAFKSSPVVSLYAESGEPPLHIRRQQLILHHHVRIHQLPGSPTYSSIILHENLNNHITRPFGIRAHEALSNIGFPTINVFPVPYCDQPVWQLNSSIHCHGFKCGKKGDVSPSHVKQLFLDHLLSEHSRENHLFTDGSKDADNVGCAAVSATVSISRKICPVSTIFTAELYAILDALIIISNSHGQKHTIFSDSQSALKAIKIYNNNHPIVQEINCWLIHLSARQKIIQLCWVPSHIDIPGNEKADTKAKSAAQSDAPIYYYNVPHKDYYSIIQRKVREQWTTAWQSITGNKLRDIKDNTSPWKSSNQRIRQNEIVLARLRLGHTRLTHRYLMEGGRPPYCGDCLVPLTIKHILAECPNYHQERLRNFPGVTQFPPTEMLKYILAEQENVNFSINAVITFLTQLNILDKI